jgi:anti-sigma regulatory factor (Ser/Thr protein kinase)
VTSTQHQHSPDPSAALSRVALTCAGYAELIAACRAAVAANDTGSSDPLVYVRDLLAARGHLPPAGASPLVVLADARTALRMTGWHAIRSGGCARPFPAAGPPREHELYQAIGAPCGCLWEAAPGTGATVMTGTCPGHDGPGQVPRAGRVCVYEITLAGLPESARTARRWAARVLGSCPAAGDVVQALSEYVANSAVHSRSARGAGTITVRLIVAPASWIRCEIRDVGPLHPARPATVHDHARPYDPDSGQPDGPCEHGRGIPLVTALAERSGTNGAGTAWFLMPWQPPAPMLASRHEETTARELA